jgi:hypothetical protein
MWNTEWKTRKQQTKKHRTRKNKGTEEERKARKVSEVDALQMLSVHYSDRVN